MEPMKRVQYLERIDSAFEVHPIVGLLGPRQCGKTTLAHQFIQRHDRECHIFDLEDPDELIALDDPKTVLESLEGTLIIDEIQRRPELFPYLRTLVDKEKRRRKILILGSASRELIRQSSESLAGRIAYIEVAPFARHELKVVEDTKLWQRGGLPLSFLAKTGSHSFEWRKAYVSTFLERDIPALGIRVPGNTLFRFWKMLAHYHGQIINYSEMGRSFGMADTSIKKYLDILTGTFMMRQLQPWHENIKKRQVKSPKVYFRDSGIYHFLLGVKNQRELVSHPKLGASWEGFALEQVVRQLQLDEKEIFFWGVHGQGEIDLIFEKNGKRFGVEFKFTPTSRSRLSPGKSPYLAQKELGLHRIFYIYPGDKRIPLAEGIEGLGLSRLDRLEMW